MLITIYHHVADVSVSFHLFQQSVDSNCSDSSSDSGLGRCAAGHEHLMRSGSSTQSQSPTDEIDMDATRGMLQSRAMPGVTPV